MACQPESRVSSDEVLVSLMRKAETLQTYFNILAVCERGEELVPGLNDTWDTIKQVKKDVETMKDYVAKMRQKNNEMKEAIEKLAEANEYMDYLENNIPERFMFHEVNSQDGRGDAAPGPSSVGVKEPFQLRTVQHLTDEEFEKIPFYLCGRLRCVDVNDFIDAYNQALEKKYHILRTSKHKLKISERQLRTALMNQAIREAPGLVFCTEEDIKRFSVVKSGISFKNMVGMLRHTQRIKEVRVDGITRLAVASSASQYEKQLNFL